MTLAFNNNISPVALLGYGSIAHEVTIAHEVKPNGQMGYCPVALEGEGSNCFSITQLVGQKRQ